MIRVRVFKRQWRDKRKEDEVEQVYAALEKLASAIDELGNTLGNWVSTKVTEQANAAAIQTTTGANAGKITVTTNTAEQPSTAEPAPTPEPAPVEPVEETPAAEQAEPPAEPETPPTV